MVKRNRIGKGKPPTIRNDGIDDGSLDYQKFRQPFSYEPSGSEDDYTEEDKLLLESVKFKRTQISHSKKHPIMDLPSDEEDTEDDLSKPFPSSSIEDMDSDIEGKEDDQSGDLPDQRAWGKSRKNFYSTDYIDEDYGGFDGDDAEVAELEEQEAREIQQRLAAELDDTDFTLDVFAKDELNDSKSKLSAEYIKTDLSQLTKRQKLSLLQKEAPELIGIVSEFRDSMSEVVKKLKPAMKLLQEGAVLSPELLHYIRTKYYLANNYAMNMGFYLLLRARRLPVAGHPVVKRLLQYRQLLLKLEPIDSVASTKIDELLIGFSSAEAPSSYIKKKSQKQHLNVLSSIKSAIEEGKQKKTENVSISENNAKEAGEFKKTDQKKETNGSSLSHRMPWQNSIHDDEEGSGVAGVPWNNHQENIEKMSEKGAFDPGDLESKRAITWEIAKNKGLTARRKKEDRNPRVKHRNKFRKAKIRRKGQIREPRKELQRYGGEMSGIKATISKSVKLK